jgi:hypothetical protein
MGYLKTKEKLDNDIIEWELKSSGISIDEFFTKHEAVKASYQMSEEEKKVRAMVLYHFALGDITMQKPRVEFNDMSVAQRAQIDEMSWNVYQPNNGEPSEQDIVGGWRSNAIRPVVRNKCISIAAHAMSRLLFPKVFAYNKDSESQSDAARVMEDLMEWAGDQSNYNYTALNRTIAALVYPASIGYTEYAEVYRPVKRTQDDGSWKEEMILDEDLSGFQATSVPVDQLYISNFYEPNIQKQSWLIWRRVRDFSLLESTYRSKYKNFEYVKPGVQLIYNDANQSFYQVYDTMMRPDMGEEVIYWNRGLDLKIIMVNGVMLTPADNPNPREDKLYPFDKFGYELINQRCFYYKSLAFKLQSDANIVNTLYPMIIDGTYLNMMPPMVSIGMDKLGMDVVVPGMVTTLTDEHSDLRPITTANNLTAGMNTLFKVDESINQSSEEPIMSGQKAPGGTTAYEISRIEQNANTVLGLFVRMISDHVRQFGRLMMGDILQYLTIADVDKIVDDGKLIYKTFFLKQKNTEKRISFNEEMPEDITEEEGLQESYKILEQEDKQKMTIINANPEKFREMKFLCAVNPDVLNPKSEDLERAFKLELYDRAIANPNVDQEEVTKDFLFGAYSEVKEPEKYIKAQEEVLPGIPQPNQGSPLAAVQGMAGKLPQMPTMGQV